MKIAPAGFEPAFSTSLGSVLIQLGYGADYEGLERLLRSRPFFRHLL